MFEQLPMNSDSSLSLPSIDAAAATPTTRQTLAVPPSSEDARLPTMTGAGGLSVVGLRRQAPLSGAEQATSGLSSSAEATTSDVPALEDQQRQHDEENDQEFGSTRL